MDVDVLQRAKLLRNGHEPAVEERKLQPLSDDRLRQIESFARHPQSGKADSFPWLVAYSYELKLAGRTSEAEQVMQEFLQQPLTPEIAMKDLHYYQTHASDDQLWRVMDAAANLPVTSPSSWSARPLALARSYLDASRIESQLSRGWNDPSYEQRVFQLLERTLEREAQRSSTINLSAEWIGGVRSLERNNNPFSDATLSIEFPPQGLGPDDDLLNMVYFVLKSALPSWIAGHSCWPLVIQPLRLIW